MKIFPNPSRGEVFLFISLPAARQVNIRILNALGEGWEQVNDYGAGQEYVIGAAIEEQGKAYFLLGCSSFEACGMGTISNKFRFFDPSAGDGPGSWNSLGTPDIEFVGYWPKAGQVAVAGC